MSAEPEDPALPYSPSNTGRAARVGYLGFEGVGFNDLWPLFGGLILTLALGLKFFVGDGGAGAHWLRRDAARPPPVRGGLRVPAPPRRRPAPAFQGRPVGDGPSACAWTSRSRRGRGSASFPESASTGPRRPVRRAPPTSRIPCARRGAAPEGPPPWHGHFPSAGSRRICCGGGPRSTRAPACPAAPRSRFRTCEAPTTGRSSTCAARTSSSSPSSGPRPRSRSTGARRTTSSPPSRTIPGASCRAPRGAAGRAPSAAPSTSSASPRAACGASGCASTWAGAAGGSPAQTSSPWPPARRSCGRRPAVSTRSSARWRWSIPWAAGFPWTAAAMRCT